MCRTAQLNVLHLLFVSSACILRGRKWIDGYKSYGFVKPLLSQLGRNRRFFQKAFPQTGKFCIHKAILKGIGYNFRNRICCFCPDIPKRAIVLRFAFSFARGIMEKETFPFDAERRRLCTKQKDIRRKFP